MNLESNFEMFCIVLLGFSAVADFHSISHFSRHELVCYILQLQYVYYLLNLQEESIQKGILIMYINLTITIMNNETLQAFSGRRTRSVRF